MIYFTLLGHVKWKKVLFKISVKYAAIKNRANSLNYNFKGEKNPQSKLKDYQILEIRAKLKSGAKGVDLALEYNVSKYCI